MLSEDAPSVQSHLSMQQNIISRLANNSANCKTWCVTLASAILVLVADEAKPDLLFIAAVPIVLFLLLDAYYLALERWFRDAYNAFVKKLHAGTATVEDVFVLNPRGSPPRLLQEILIALLSFSVWPFYLTLAVLLWLLRVRIT